MRTLILAGLMAATGWAANAQNLAVSDQYFMGVGRWDCAKLVRAVDNGPELDRGQAAGWILGFWSAATVYEGSAFVDKVETTGARNIYDLTVRLCRENPGTLVGNLSNSLLQNTRNEE